MEHKQKVQDPPLQGDVLLPVRCYYYFGYYQYYNNNNNNK